MKTSFMNKTAALLLAAFLCAGCDKDAGPGLTDDSPAAIEIAGAGIRAEVSSRANTTITSGSMGVFRTTAGSYTAQYNAKYTYKNGSWTADPTPVYVGGANATLCAYYPYGAATFNANSFVCTLSAQKWTEAKDLCYATSGGNAVCNKTPTATFAMTRAYARIKLSIQHGAAYIGNCNITNVNLQNSTGNNFFSSRTLDISSGVNGGSVTAGGWTYALNTGSIVAGATNTAYDVLIPPQPVNGGLRITLTVDGANRAVSVPAAQFTSNSLAAGRQYTIQLVVSEVSVSIAGVTKTDMGTAPPTPNIGFEYTEPEN